MQRCLVDANFLVSAIRSCDKHHWPCYAYLKNHQEWIWVVPTIAYFEYQATQSRLRREGKGAFRELYIPNCEVYDITLQFVQEAGRQDLANHFDTLRGADLIYACVAKIEGIPIVTCDNDFSAYASDIVVINPLQAENGI